MNRSLSKADSKRRGQLVAALRGAQSKLEDEISQFNAKLVELHVPVEAAITAYNEVVAEAEGLREDIHSQQESDYDEKGDKWKDGEKGEAFKLWMDGWMDGKIPLNPSRSMPRPRSKIPTWITQTIWKTCQRKLMVANER